MAVLGYLPKLKRSLGLAFGAHVLHVFSAKVSLFNTLSMTKFQYHTFFPSQDIKQNVLLSSYLAIDDVINFKIYLQTTSKAMTGREKKRQGRKYKNLNISRMKRAF